jgi:hypothetical protein
LPAADQEGMNGCKVDGAQIVDLFISDKSQEKANVAFVSGGRIIG